MRLQIMPNPRSALLASLLLAVPSLAGAQKTAPKRSGPPAVTAAPAAPAAAPAPSLPITRADVLLQAGRWAEAEEAFYAQSRIKPREPLARAALGRYLAMKGAVIPGTILIQEAQKFGLDAGTARALLAPWGEVQSWRVATMRDPAAGAMSLFVRPPRDTMALFQMPLPRGPNEPRAKGTAAGDTIWADVFPRMMTAAQMKKSTTPQMGIEMLEQQLPAIDVARNQLTLHADSRTALRTIGRRYPVLRDTSDVLVLVGPDRVMSLAPALREIEAKWWQLDLLHGILVVR
jgi:hypothetical protein